jgi:hypothetical protein
MSTGTIGNVQGRRNQLKAFLIPVGLKIQPAKHQLLPGTRLVVVCWFGGAPPSAVSQEAGLDRELTEVLQCVTAFLIIATRGLPMFDWLSSFTRPPVSDTPAQPIPLDIDAQPPAFLNAGLRSARSTTEVIGFLKGVLADGTVSESEVIALARWLCANTEGDEWPVGVIVDRVGRAMQDGALEPHELADLKELFERVVGGPTDEAGNRPTKLPLTQPPPAIQFPGPGLRSDGPFHRRKPQILRRHGGRAGWDLSPQSHAQDRIRRHRGILQSGLARNVLRPEDSDCGRICR